VSYFKLDNRARTTKKAQQRPAGIKRPQAKAQLAHAHEGSNGHANGFDLKLADGPSDADFTEF
jgi:hypothetical protein